MNNIKESLTFILDIWGLIVFDLATLDIVTVSGKWIVIFYPDKVWLLYGKIEAYNNVNKQKQWWVLGVGNRYIFCGYCLLLYIIIIHTHYMFTLQSDRYQIFCIVLIHLLSSTSIHYDINEIYIWFIHSCLFPVLKTTTIAQHEQY